MVKKSLIIAMSLLSAGCLPYVSQELNSYQFKGKEITLGMNPAEVRAVAGPPTKIERPNPYEAVLSPTGVDINKGKQNWQFGSIKNGDNEQIAVMFSDGIVTRILKVAKKQ